MRGILNKNLTRKNLAILISSAALLGLAACSAGTSPGGGYYPPYDSGYYRPDYGYDYDRYDRWRERQRWEEHERREHEREDRWRERKERERDRYRAPPPPPPPPPPREELRCPPGTHESTHRCTAEERKRGCKDYGGPNGRGCSNF